MNVERAFIISPHQDDAVLSAGMLLRRYNTVDVANLFTQSNSHILPDVGEDVRKVSEMRKEEDRRIHSAYNFHFHDAGFADSEVRGIAWNDYWADIDERLVAAAEQFVADTLSNSDVTDVYIPAGFGMHPDHLVAHTAGLRVMGARGIQSWFLYADQPYYNSSCPVRLRTHDILSVRQRLDLPFQPELKRPMLECYPSQLSSQRIDRVAAVGREYLWRGSTDIMHASDVIGRYEQSTGLFGTPAWYDASRLHHPANGRDTYEVRSDEGHIFKLPFMTDSLMIEDTPTSVLRFEGAGWFDYLDFEKSPHFDGAAWAELIAQASQTSADILWISGIREDSALYKVLEVGGSPGYLFAGQSSLMLDCHKDGYEAWYKNASQKARKKVRHTKNKTAEFVKAGGVVDIHNATAADVNIFLDLQQRRAAEADGKLDTFSEDRAYSAFLHELAALDELKVVAMQDGETPVGAMLFHANPQTGNTVSIINQGFDPKYSSFSPGFVMQLGLIEWAHGKNIDIVDYLKGAEPYKRIFANRELGLYKYIQPLRPVSNTQWENIKKFGDLYVE